MTRPVTLSFSETEAAAAAIRFSSKQAQLMLRFLAAFPDTASAALTAVLTANFSSANLSDISRQVNRFLAGSNLIVRCRRPEATIARPDGGPSRQVLWGVYKTDGQAS